MKKINPKQQAGLYKLIMEKIGTKLKQAIDENVDAEDTAPVAKTKDNQEKPTRTKKQSTENTPATTSNTKEYKAYKKVKTAITELRKTADRLFNEIDKYEPGHAEEMWNYVYETLGRNIKITNMFGGPKDVITEFNKPAEKAVWTSVMSMSTVTVADLDNPDIFKKGFYKASSTGNSNDLLTHGFDCLFCWLKCVLYAIASAKHGFQEFDNNTFYNCAKPDAICKKFGYKVA